MIWMAGEPVNQAISLSFDVVDKSNYLGGKMNTLKFCHNIYKANASLIIVLCLFSQNL